MQQPARSIFTPDRYSAKRMTKPINFICRLRDANSVFLTGEFNSWDPAAHPMARQPDGTWLLQLPLHHGHHQYAFLVDGQMVLDPHAHGVARDPRGHKVSLLAVS